MLEHSGELQPSLGRRIEQRDRPMSRARRTLPDEPPVAPPIGWASPATDRTRRPRRATSRASGMVERVDNGLRRRAPTVRRPRAYRSIRHARRHRRDQLGRKQQGGAAIGSEGNSRRPAADTTPFDHRKIPPVYARVSTGAKTRAANSCNSKVAGCGKIFREKMTGTSADRPQLPATFLNKAGHGVINLDDFIP